MKKLLLAALFSFLLYSLFGQITETFPAFLQDGGQDSEIEDAFDILATSDGGYLLSGRFKRADGDLDPRVVKVNANGNYLNALSLNESNFYDAFVEAVEYDGLFYIVGYYTTLVDGQERFRTSLTVINTNDLTIVALPGYFFGLADNEQATTIEISPDGNLIIGGHAYDDGFQNRQGFIAKININSYDLISGMLISNLGYRVDKIERNAEDYLYVFGNIFNASSSCATSNVDEGNDNASNAGLGGGNGINVFVYKYTNSLNNAPGWSGAEYIGGDTDDDYLDAAVTADGGFVVLGYTWCQSIFGITGPNNIGSAGNRQWIYKGNSNGSFDWNKAYFYDAPLNAIRAIEAACINDDIYYVRTVPSGEINSFQDVFKVVPALGPDVDLPNFQYSTTHAEMTDLTTSIDGYLAVGGNDLGPNNEDFAIWIHNNFTVNTCEGICSTAIPLDCGIPYNGNNSGSSNDLLAADYLSCNAGFDAELNPFTAGDDIFVVNKQEPGDLVVTLFSDNVDLDLFLFEECDGSLSQCVDWSINFNDNYETIVASVPDGLYYIVVDGYNSNEQGNYTLTATCADLNCSSTFITCGQTLSGSNLGLPNNVSRYCNAEVNQDNPQVRPSSGNGCTGPEKLYRFVVEGTQEVVITLDPVSSNDDFELFLVGSCDETDCIASSTNGAGENEVVSATLTSGTYYIVVDGWRESVGSFSITLDCCEDPEYTYDCAGPTYTYNGSGFSYTLFGNHIPNYAVGVDWLIGSSFIPASGNSVSYDFGVPGDYLVCAPYYNEDGCIDYCCADYCIKDLPDCFSGFVPGCTGECSCTESSSLLPDPFQCEGFQLYTPNTAIVPASLYWADSPGESNSAEVQTLDEIEAGLAVSSDGNPSSVYYQFFDNISPDDNLNCQERYRISWRQEVTANIAGYKILYDKNASADFANTALQVGFSPGQLTVTKGDCLCSEEFNYSMGGFAEIMHIIDLSTNTLELWVNSDLINITDYTTSLTGDNVSSRLGAINFYTEAGANYLVDDICLRVANPTGCPTGGDQVCIANGDTYANACEAAQVGLYTPDEYQACINVCELNSEFIGRADGQNIEATINDYEQTANLFYAIPDIELAYGGDVPFPLYTNQYVFEYVDDPDVVQINITSDPNLRAFLFECVCDENGCTTNYIGESINVFSNLPDGTYYVVVASSSPNIDYTISIVPSSPCAISAADGILNCGSSVSNDFAGIFPGYAHEGSISECYSGTRSYSGAGKVYRLEIDAASIVDIDFSTQGDGGGLFVFGSSCGRNCLGYTETSSFGGSSTLENLSLGDGYYYLVAFNNGNVSSFDITVNCANDDANQILFEIASSVGGCDLNLGVSQNVGINLDEVTAPTPGPEDRFLLYIKPPGANGEVYPAENINAAYQGENIIFPTLYEYNGLTPDEQCAFEIGDTIALYMSSGEDGTRLCLATFEPVDNNNVTAGSTFVGLGAVSEISDFEVLEAATVTVYPSTQFLFTAEGGTKDFQLRFSDENIAWDIFTEEDWIDLSTTATDVTPIIGTITVGPNDGVASRTGQIIARTTTFPTLQKIITVQQEAPCLNTIVSLANNNDNTVRVCQGDNITLQAEVRLANNSELLPDDLFNFYWGDETTPGSSTQTLDSDDFPLGNSSYPLRVEQKECINSISTTFFTIDVERRPATPELEDDISSCGGVDVFSIDNPEVGVNYVWRNVAGTILQQSEQTTFTPPGTGTYSVRAENADFPSCQSSAVTLQYTATPIPVLTNTTTPNGVCLNESILLTVDADPGDGLLLYNWNGQITTEPNYSYIPPGLGLQTITVSASVGACESEPIEIDILALSPPELTVINVECDPDLASYSILFSTDDDFIIDITSASLSEVGENYLLSDIAIGTDVNFTVSNAFCEGDPVPVPSPDCLCPTIATPSTEVPLAYVLCNGDDYPMLSVNEEEGVTINWYITPGGSLLDTGPSYQTEAPGDYYAVAVSNEAPQCSSQNLEFNVEELPEIGAAITSVNSTVCAGASVELIASVSSGRNFSYSWSNNLGNNSVVNAFVNEGTNTFTLTVTDVAEPDCFEVVSVDITGVPLPELTVIEVSCDPGLETYSILFSTDDNFNYNITSGSLSTVGNNFLLGGIAIGSNVNFTVSNAFCNGQSEFVESPNCLCPTIGTPTTEVPTEYVLCHGDAYPMLSVNEEDGVTISWYSTPGGVVLDTGPSYQTEGPGDYYAVAISDEAPQCSSQDLAFNVEELPEIGAGIDVDALMVCAGTDVELRGTVLSNRSFSYSWSNGLGNNPTVDATIVEGANNFSLTITDVAVPNCFEVVSVEVTGMLQPDMPILNTTNLTSCTGTDEFEITNAQAGLTYVWRDASGNTLQNSNLATFLPPASGIYSVRAFNTAFPVCQSELQTLNYEEIETPTISDASGDTDLCLGESTMLQVETNLSGDELVYTWNGNINTTEPSLPFEANALGTQNVTVFVANGECISNMITIEINIIPAPQLDFDPDEVGEDNCSPDLTTYSISFSTNDQVLDANELPVPVTGTGNPYVMTGIPVGTDFDLVIGNDNCASAPVMVVSPACNCSAVGNPIATNGQTEFVICSNEEFPEFSASVNDPEQLSINWYNTLTGGTPLETGPVFQPSSAGVYYAEAFNSVANQCVSAERLAFEVTVVEEIVATISGLSTACTNDEPIVLNTNVTGGSSPANLRYEWSNGLGNSSTAQLTVMEGVHTYSLTVSDMGSSCEATTEFTVEGIALPEYTVTVQPFCIDENNYTLSINTEADIVTTDIGNGVITANGNNYQFIVPVGTDFNIRLRNNAGGLLCSLPDIPVSSPDCNCFGLNFPPIVVVGDQIANICLGDDAVDLAIEDPGDEYTIRWFDNEFLNGTALNEGRVYNTNVAGNYYVALYDEANCHSTPILIGLNVNPLPLADAGDYQTVCLDGNVQLDASGSSGNGELTYQWFGNETLDDETSVMPSFIATNASTTFLLLVTDANGCTNNDQVNITTEEPPSVVVVEQSEILCFGDATGQLQGFFTTNNTPVLTSWSTGESGLVISNLTAGEYTFFVEDVIGCQSSFTYELEQPERLDSIDETIVPISTGNEEGSIAVLYAGGVEPYSYEWYNAAEELVSMAEVLVTTAAGEYSLILTDQNGCTDTSYFSLLVDITEIADLGALRIYPNPTSDFSYIDIDFSRTVDLEIGLFNEAGQLVRKQTKVNISKERIPLNLSDLPAGIYWLDLQMATERIVKKLIIIR